MSVDPNTKCLQIVRSGHVIESYDLSEYKFGLVMGTVTIQNKSTNEILKAFSPNYYDYVEVCSDDNSED